MIIKLTTVRERVEQMLADTGNDIWDRTWLDEAIRHALYDYSLVNPVRSITTLTASADSTELDISSLTLVYPNGSGVGAWAFSVEGNVATASLLPANLEAGENVLRARIKDRVGNEGQGFVTFTILGGTVRGTVTDWDGSFAAGVPIAVGSSDTRRAAYDQGLSPNYELELDEGEPIVYISAKGETPEQSGDTLDFVIIELERQLLDRQGVDPNTTEPDREFVSIEILSEVKAIEDNSASVKVLGSQASREHAPDAGEVG